VSLRLAKFAILLFVVSGFLIQTIFADAPKPELLELFPDQVGVFKRSTSPTGSELLKVAPEATTGQSEYTGNGQRFLVEIVKFHQDTEAYSLLSVLAVEARAKDPKVEIANEYGTASFVEGNRIAFFKGLELVRISSLGKPATSASTAFARTFADAIDKGEADVPALVKHLPNPEQSQKIATFLTRFKSLQAIEPTQAVLGAIETDGNADAASVVTDKGKVLVIEYNTPQLAKENDDRIVARIQELWRLGQPAPIAYKRVGNYSVFVFDSPDNETAKKLIDQVKYEQVVQWLGDNPNIYKAAEKQYVETTLGVFIAVVKASGFAFAACLGLGGVIGTLLFTRRRAQQRTLETFSDAGGMLRLNIDELTPQTDPARLLGPGVD
jgi:hypothetical protein